MKSYEEGLRILATGPAMSERRASTKAWAIMMLAKIRLTKAIRAAHWKEHAEAENAAQLPVEPMRPKFQGLADLSVRCRDCGHVQGPACLAEIGDGTRCMLPLIHEPPHAVRCLGCKT